MAELKTNDWKRKRAIQAHDYRLNGGSKPFLKVKRRGKVPVHHPGFYHYLRWVLGKLPPLYHTPIDQTEPHFYNDHVKYYGEPRQGYEVIPFLSGLLGHKFAQVFACESDIDDYEFVVKAIAKASLELETIPEPMAKARIWLDERLEQLKRSSGTLDCLVTPSASSYEEGDSIVPAPDLPMDLDAHHHEVVEQILPVEDASYSAESVALADESTLTVDDLCLAPFTEADLASLLRSLGVLDGQNNCLTNHLKGKAQGRRSRFTAAYRVLQRHGLMAATQNSAEWAAAFKTTYNVDIKEASRAYTLTAQGKGPSNSSNDFKDGVTEATSWLANWLSKQPKPDEK